MAVEVSANKARARPAWLVFLIPVLVSCIVMTVAINFLLDTKAPLPRRSGVQSASPQSLYNNDEERPTTTPTAPRTIRTTSPVRNQTERPRKRLGFSPIAHLEDDSISAPPPPSATQEESDAEQDAKERLSRDPATLEERRAARQKLSSLVGKPPFARMPAMQNVLSRVGRRDVAEETTLPQAGGAGPD